MPMMTSLTLIALLIILAGAIISLLSLHIYNKRLDKITKGEIRDVHSKIPEPVTTAGASYKIVLMVICIITFISITALYGQISFLNEKNANMQSAQNDMEDELTQIRQLLEENNRLVSNTNWELTDADLDNNTVNVNFKAELKKFSDDTTVTLDLNGTSIPLSTITPGTYGKKFEAKLFEDYTQTKLLIKQNGITTTETTLIFPESLFWDYLPIPSLQCCFDSSINSYSGWYMLTNDHPDDIEKVNVTYVSNGNELKTIDVTKEAKDQSQITVDKDLGIKKNLTLCIEILTKTGYKIQKQSAVIFEDNPNYVDDDYMKIYDPNGNLVWTELIPIY